MSRFFCLVGVFWCWCDHPFEWGFRPLESRFHPDTRRFRPFTSLFRPDIRRFRPFTSLFRPDTCGFRPFTLLFHLQQIHNHPKNSPISMPIFLPLLSFTFVFPSHAKHFKLVTLIYRNRRLLSLEKNTRIKSKKISKSY